MQHPSRWLSMVPDWQQQWGSLHHSQELLPGCVPWKLSGAGTRNSALSRCGHHRIFLFFLQPSCEGSELWPSAATWDLVLCSVLSLEVFLMRKDDELVKCSRGFYPDGYQQGRSCNNLLRTSLPVPEACGKKRRWQSTRETLCILPPYTYLFSQITTSKIQHIAEARVGPASRNLERERGGTVFVCTCVLPESR